MLRSRFFKTKILIVTSVVLFLFFIASIYYFESSLKKNLELKLSQAYGAEVNIAKFRLNYFKSSLKISGIEFTYKNEPTKNILQIDQISMIFKDKELYRNTYTSDKAQVSGLQLFTNRKKKGKIYATFNSQHSFKNKITLPQGLFSEKIFFSQKSNTDFEPEQKRSPELQESILHRSKQWNRQLKIISPEKTIANIHLELKKIKLQKTNNVKEKALQNLLSQLNKTQKKYNETLNRLANDIKSSETQINAKKLPKDLSTNSIDDKVIYLEKNKDSFSKALFLNEAYRTSYHFEKLLDLLQNDLNPKRSTKNKGQKTRSFFGFTTSPKIFIKEVNISSKSAGLKDSGEIKGQILNFSNLIKRDHKPIEFNFTADFPELNIYGLALVASFNNVKGDKHWLNAKLSSHPKLYRSNSYFPLNFKADETQLDLRLTSKENKTSLSFRRTFKKISFKSPRDDTSKYLINPILGSLKEIKIEGRLHGYWPDLEVGLHCDEEAKILEAYKKILQRKTLQIKQVLTHSKISESGSQLAQKEIQATLKSVIEKIESERATNQSRFNQLKEQIHTSLTNTN